MTIKEATSRMLGDIRGELNKQTRTSDKSIAKQLGISPTIFSNLILSKTAPGISLWFRIYKMHKQLNGEERSNEIIKKID